jgi:hypothetical protein
MYQSNSEKLLNEEIALHFCGLSTSIAREAAPGLHRPKRNGRRLSKMGLKVENALP